MISATSFLLRPLVTSFLLYSNTTYHNSNCEICCHLLNVKILLDERHLVPSGMGVALSKKSICLAFLE